MGFHLELSLLQELQSIKAFSESEILKETIQQRVHSGLKQGARWGVAQIWLQTQF